MKKTILPWIHLLLAVTVGGGTLYGLTQAVGPVPALAPSFVAGDGVWTDLADSQTPEQNRTLDLPDLKGSVGIVFEADGSPHIRAEHDADLWYSIGYLHAHNRLFQMDLMRRQGAGTLAEILGAGALSSDEFQRQLGLARTAEAEWQALPVDSPTREMLTAYSAGVNAVIGSDIQNGELPMTFKLLGYEPRPWTPQDTLVLKGVLAQMMSLSDNPLYYALYADSLGYERTMEWFPVQPPNEQSPFAVGPYEGKTVEPMPISAEQVFSAAPLATDGTELSTANETVGPSLDSATVTAVESLLTRFKQLPETAFHAEANSNAWAVDGTKTATGKPLLAGDPHLGLSLPAVWYQLQAESPGYQYAGVTVPGIPLALIGKNERISWSMTNGQTQQTFYYKEKTDDQNRYYWNGEWREMDVRTEQILVKGGGVKALEIRSTVHGPVVTQLGQTVAINWLGAIPSSPNGGLDSLRRLMQAASYDQFREAFREWQAPAMNYLYADRKGEIGMISAGLYPVFRDGAEPWLPLAGTGEHDFIGRVPFDRVPQVHNPADGIIGSANQRQTESAYPYYTGTTMDFAPGYRANRIYDLLRAKDGWTSEQFAAMQNDIHDPLAAEIVPALLQALEGADLSPSARTAVDALRSWNGNMAADSVAASVWWRFWEEYAHTVFDPWLEKHNVPFDEYRKLGAVEWWPSLHQNLQVWTLEQPDHPAFDHPLSGAPRTAADAMREAFRNAVQKLAAEQGDDVGNWQWQGLHKRSIPSLMGIPELGHGPLGAGGGNYTVNVAPGMESSHGPSWRMVVDLATGQASGSYPGGQSENPLSPWYQDRIQTWWDGEHRPMLDFADVASKPAHTWELRPQKEGN